MSSGLQYSLAPNPALMHSAAAAAMMPGAPAAAATMMPAGHGFISPPVTYYTPQQLMWMQHNYMQYMTAQYMH